MRGGAVVALVTRRGHAARLRPGLPARAGLRGGRAGGRGAAGAVGGARRAGRLRAAVGRLALRRLPAAQAGRAGRGLRLAGDRRRVRVAAAGGGVAGGAGRARPGAAGGGLPGADEAARGGRAGVGVRAGRAVRGGGPRGEVVLVVGGAPRRTGVDEAAVDAVRRLVEAGARARVAAGVVGELTGAPANALYQAVLRRSRRPAAAPRSGPGSTVARRDRLYGAGRRSAVPGTSTSSAAHRGRPARRRRTRGGQRRTPRRDRRPFRRCRLTRARPSGHRARAPTLTPIPPRRDPRRRPAPRHRLGPSATTRPRFATTLHRSAPTPSPSARSGRVPRRTVAPCASPRPRPPSPSRRPSPPLRSWPIPPPPEPCDGSGRFPAR